MTHESSATPIAFTFALSPGWKGVDALQAVLSEAPGGAVAAYLIDQIPGVRRQKALALITDILDALDCEERGLLVRVEGAPHLRDLLARAVALAADTEHRALIRVLAHTAAAAFVDDARLDEAHFLLRVAGRLQPIHIRALRLLESADLAEESGLDLAEALGVSQGVAESLSGELIRSGLVAATGMSFRSLFTSVRLAPLGEQLLRQLREAESELALHTEKPDRSPP